MDGCGAVAAVLLLLEPAPALRAFGGLLLLL
jgi:hypothetical protein